MNRKNCILFCLAISIGIVSVSQIYFFPPVLIFTTDIDEGGFESSSSLLERREKSKLLTTNTNDKKTKVQHQLTTTGKQPLDTTTATTTTTTTTNNNDTNEKQKYERIAMIARTKRKQKTEKNSSNHNDAIGNTTTTAATTRIRDGSINKHVASYKRRIEMYNDYLLDKAATSQQEGDVMLVPDVEKILNEAETQTKIIERTRNNDHGKNNDNDNDNDASWLVIHIGPPKTATTTIQCGLEQYSLRLAIQDKYHFLGGGCGIPNQEYVMPNSEQTVLRRLIISELGSRKDKGGGGIGGTGHDGDPKSHDHLIKMIQRMAYLRQKQRSVILSGELFGSQLSSRKDVMESFRDMLVVNPSSMRSTQPKYRPSNNSTRRRRTMMIPPTQTAGFQSEHVRIVLAYRHFVDWLPSYYYQNELIIDSHMDTQWLLHNPLTGYVVPQTKQIGKRVQPFLQYADRYLTKWERISEDYIQWMTTLQQSQSQKNDTININNNDDRRRRLKRNQQSTMVQMLPKHRFSIHPSWWLYTMWSQYFPLKNQVQVYDMHSPMNMNRPNDDMLTDFICHMIPTATQTCKQLQVQQQLSYTNATDVNNINNNDVFNYDEPYLHSKLSFLVNNRISTSNNNDHQQDSTTTTEEEENGGEGDDNASNNDKQTLMARPSSDHHATRIIEELLIRGDLRNVTYSTDDDDNDANSIIHQYFRNEAMYYEYYQQPQQVEKDDAEAAARQGKNDRSNTSTNTSLVRFDSRMSEAPPPLPEFNGYTKPDLIKRTNLILEYHGILIAQSSSPSSSSTNPTTTTTAFSDKYFDCISPILEERLLNASRTFMDLMYRHTPMLSQATAAAFSFQQQQQFDDNTSTSSQRQQFIREEKNLRWKQAKIEHERLFQKNKRKGKYCDINLDKVRGLI